MERKLATALFVDLVDSTALVAGSDPEVVRRRVTEFFDRAAAHIASFGGTVEKFAGDAVVAVFGVPIAHEDDAERAVRAAVAILETGDGELPVRIGIEAGEVVAETGDSTFATGEALNVAARLQQCAEPGEILIGPTAYGLTAGTVTVESVGDRSLKGFSDRRHGPARRLRRPSCGPPDQRGGAVRRPRRGARAAPERLRAGCPRPARPARDDLRRPRHREEPPRQGVLRRSRAHERADREMPAVRRGDRVPAARRDGAGRGGDLGGRLAGGGDREATRSVLERRRRRSPRARLRCAGQRLGRSSRPGDRVGCARVGDEPRRGTAARARVRGRPLGGGAAPRPRRAPRRSHRRCPGPDRLPRTSGASRLAAGAGAEGDDGRSRSSSGRFPSPRSRSSSTRSSKARRCPTGCGRVLLDKTEGNPLVRRGDDPDARRAG